MIELRKVSKQFGNRVILDFFDYTFEGGKMIGIKGASGSGKTTLLNLIGQIDLAYSGEIVIDGKVVDSGDAKKRQRILKKNIYYLFQNYALVDDLTVGENLAIMTKINPSYKVKTREALKRVGLDESLMTMPVYTLSGGEQQRVSLARAFLREFDTILADEPTGNLDGENADTVINLLKEMTLSGKNVIIASHDDRVLEVCDDIITLTVEK